MLSLRTSHSSGDGMFLHGGYEHIKDIETAIVAAADSLSTFNSKVISESRSQNFRYHFFKNMK